MQLTLNDMAMSNCPTSAHPPGYSELRNVSAILQQRYDEASEEDRRRLKSCWGYNDCGDCHRSDEHCGWCALSGTCLPLPHDRLSLTIPLLSPLRHKNICPTGSERFELRTRGLGCQVSTITFLTSLVTILCTIAGLIILYGLVKLFQLIGFGTKAGRGGWMIYDDGKGKVEEGPWVRGSEGWGRWWRRMIGRPREGEDLVVDDGMEERSKWVWWNVFRRGGGDRSAGARSGAARRENGDAGERRPLLG